MLTAMLRRLVMLAAAVIVTVGAPASAAEAPPGALRLSPEIAGKRSALDVDLGPGALTGGAQSRRPQSVALFGAAGLKIDLRAVAGRCPDSGAGRFDCPESSRIGRGTAQGHAEGALVPGGRYDFTAQIDVFLGHPREPGDLAGLVVKVSEPQSNQHLMAGGSIRRIAQGPFGSETRIDSLSGGSEPPPGVTVTLDRVQLRVAASRTVRRKVTVRRHGKRRRVTRRVRYGFLTNPRTCAGSWPYRVHVEYSDGGEDFDGTVPCRTG